MADKHPEYMRYILNYTYIHMLFPESCLVQHIHGVITHDYANDDEDDVDVDGDSVGKDDGDVDDESVGKDDGDVDDDSVGKDDGDVDGDSVGKDDGDVDGDSVGKDDGECYDDECPVGVC